MLRFMLLTALLLLIGVQIGYAQGETPVECGTIIDGEFKARFQPQNYVIQMDAGDKITVQGVPLGDTLTFTLGVYAPDGNIVAASEGQGTAILTNAPTAVSGVLSANGTYRITAHNATIDIINGGRLCEAFCNEGGVGVYTLFIGCTLRDGTVIEPGDTMLIGSDGPQDALNAITASMNDDAIRTFSGTGFPGLAPVDFGSVSALPLSVGVGTMTPNNSEITAFTFDANAGDVFQLDFARLAGNLNLGLVVLSASNEVVFQASLVTSESLSTRLTLPSAGAYTIGVFRVDLLPPGDPQATAFQVTGTLNP